MYSGGPHEKDLTSERAKQPKKGAGSGWQSFNEGGQQHFKNDKRNCGFRNLGLTEGGSRSYS